LGPLYIVVVTENGDGLSALQLVVKELPDSFGRVAHGGCFVWDKVLARNGVVKMGRSDAYVGGGGRFSPTQGVYSVIAALWSAITI
jgi:hypothetical protein